MIKIKSITYLEKKDEINIIFKYNDSVRIYDYPENIYDYLAANKLTEDIEITEEIFQILRLKHFQYIAQKNLAKTNVEDVLKCDNTDINNLI